MLRNETAKKDLYKNLNYYKEKAKRERERETHVQQVSDEWTHLGEPVFFPFSSDVDRGQREQTKNNAYNYAQRSMKTRLSDSESCVNVREWHACVNMGDT